MKSLRRFLLFTSLPLIALVGVAAALIGYDGTRHEADEVFDAQMVQYARLLAHTLPRGEIPHEDTDSGLQPPTLADTELDLEYTTGHEYETRLTFQYWTGDQLVARSRFAPRLQGSQIEPGFHSIERDERQWRVFTLELDGGRRVIVTEDEEVRSEIALALAAQALLPLLIGIPILGLLLSLVINLAIRRIDAIAGDVAERSPTDLSPVSTSDAPRELSRLLESINGLLERLRAGIEREKQFSADAAHELRTPITGIRIHLQNALAAAPDDAELRQSLEQAQVGIGRMSHIVEQLLHFNRAVNREEPTGTQIIDLASVIEDVIEAQRPLLERRRQELTTRLQPARVTGNSDLLAIVFGNLLANASQYTPTGGNISVTLTSRGKHVQAMVDDSGPGMTHDQRERAFSRFYRGNESESGDQVGCGLGLAIAQRVCERHGATITLDESQTLGGLRATVLFDRYDPPRS